MPTTVKLNVCQSVSCGSKGSPKLVCDIEELCASKVDVRWSSCLDHCGKGPNIEVVFPGNKAAKVVEHVDNFKKMEQLLQKEAGLKFDKQSKQVAELKYEVRRGTDEDDRLNKLGKAFKLVGGEVGVSKSNPQLAAELLVLRSRVMVNIGGVSGGATDSNGEMALDDAQAALALSPNFARAHIAVAYALERLGRLREAEKTLQDVEDVADDGKYGFSNQDIGELNQRLQPKLKAQKLEEDAQAAALKEEEKKKQEEEAAAKRAAKAAAKKKAAAAKAKKQAAEEAKKKKLEAKKKAEEDEALARKADDEDAVKKAEQDGINEVGGKNIRNTAYGDNCVESTNIVIIKCPPLKDRIVSL